MSQQKNKSLDFEIKKSEDISHGELNIDLPDLSNIEAKTSEVKQEEASPSKMKSLFRNLFGGSSVSSSGSDLEVGNCGCVED